MVHTSSARFSTKTQEKTTEEEDLLSRSQNKMDDPPNKSSIVSYKEKLLNLFGEEVVSYTRNKDYDTMEDEIGVNTESRPYVDGLDIPLQDNEWDQWSHSWEKTLIVTLMGKRANFKILENYIQKQWTKNGKVKLVDMEDGYFLVYFSTEADYIHALYEGPWMLADHYLLVQRWRKMFLQSAATMKKVAVWIRIPRLPLELYNDTFLTRIGNALGTMLKVDRLTSIHSRGKFARICVEINLEQPLVTHIFIRGYKFFLQYEGLHSICFRCGRYGHKKDQCCEFLGETAKGTKENLTIGASEIDTTGHAEAMTAAAAIETNPTAAKKPETDAELIAINSNATNKETHSMERENQFGPWLTVKKKNRRKIPPKVQQSDNSKTNMEGNQNNNKDNKTGTEGSKNADLPQEKNKEINSSKMHSSNDRAVKACFQPNEREHATTERVRNNTGVKGATKHPSSVESKKIVQTSQEKKMEEQQILEIMRSIEKQQREDPNFQNFTNNSFMTQVFTPDKASMELAERLNKTAKECSREEETMENAMDMDLNSPAKEVKQATESRTTNEDGSK
ncbi:unnamed protein product [Trifolium pratense]|uniref:Uncharacterized protein n=1 Tax=Trifolium pratense TaxID=57577 RepID=A0ACB0KFQ2_TRIPR|nr:unnamed protein product [Trifolium pratense]